MRAWLKVTDLDSVSFKECQAALTSCCLWPLVMPFSNWSNLGVIISKAAVDVYQCKRRAIVLSLDTCWFEKMATFWKKGGESGKNIRKLAIIFSE